MVNFCTHPIIFRFLNIILGLELVIAKPLRLWIYPPCSRATATSNVDPLTIKEMDTEISEDKNMGKEKIKMERRKKNGNFAPITDEPVK